MTGYILRRLAVLLPLLLGLSIFSFTLGQIAPGDPARALLILEGDSHPTDEQVAAFREELGFNDPAVVQYVRWLGKAARGDLGTSFRTGQSVATRLRQALPVTVELALLAFAVMIAVGIPIGVAAALRAGRLPDHLSRLLSLAGASLPSYWFAYLLIIVFAVRLDLLPTGGVQSATSYVLPTATLALYSTAVMGRLTRASMLEILGDEYIRAARARGVPQRRIVVRHALRVALNPIVTYGGLVLGSLLGGAVIVETVFAMPGLGRLVVDAIRDRDFPVVQGFLLLFGTIVVLINLAVDVLYGVLDPRVRLADRGDTHAR